MGKETFRIFILLAILVLMNSCTHSQIMFDCKEVVDSDDVYVCKTILPWK